MQISGWLLYHIFLQIYSSAHYHHQFHNKIVNENINKNDFANLNW